ncbi:inner-membrane translocator [Alkalihalobacillus macyae]|uniref:inner-membrane translocator n=1 Tax=Guptibacillus hwajinpoensis TaxID=208199 RepID=UPI00273C4A7C|nr:inner-membrane translocator [Alkalihalobacillus macyae]MDP4551415.1 inner-membrane translocator [Alkalihalobacillus macyae]
MDVLMYLFLAALLIPANIFMIKWHRSGILPLWASGILLAILGVGLGFVVGGILVGPGNAGQGGSLMAAFVGLITVANGLIHFLIGLIIVIGKLFTKKNTQV